MQPLTSPYIPNTEAERAELLRAVGARSVDDLFHDIPEGHRNPPLEMPAPLSEMELRAELQRLSEKNFHAGKHPSFLGAGVYHHYTPAAIAPLVLRGEFLTSYTPYQPEVSQGTLQGTFEFQTMTAQLLGMEVANAGMYDGGTALAEAALMACRVTKRYKVAVVDTVNPHYVEAIRTYASPQGIDVYAIPAGATSLQADTACVVAQYPNFLGYVEDVRALADLAHGAGALLCTANDPVAMALFRSPGSFGVDIATAEAQALGVPPSFGGPFVGMFACKSEYVRQMPGRIAGRTTDAQGRSGYVLTLQPREQHIRRERATSNICTSTALIALWSTIYVALMGKRGLRHVAELCYQKAHYAASEIAKLPGYRLPVGGTFFQEFVVSCPRPPAEVSLAMEEAGIIGGYDVSDRVPNGLLLCVTEVNTKAQIDKLVSVLGGLR
ncbi:MAG: aminomethyl-transferring glycine dehydrogenase subunit GcvPA [SAR202 cluster bacterium]|nr:aminomethyl-transferring glycine dehydrogenase subunit GcvPA [SAR202 cluster bacterium]